MSFAIKNNTNGNVNADGINFAKGATKTLPFVGPQVIELVKSGQLISTPALIGMNVDGDLVNNLAQLTNNTTGTAATITNGAGTLAAITDVPTAANAIATLAAQLEGQRVLILNMMNVIENLSARKDHH